MTIQFDLFKKEIADFLQKGIEYLYQKYSLHHTTQRDEILPLLTVPPEFHFGQCAFPCFPFAKKLKLPPQKIALELQDEFSRFPKKYIQKVDAVQGYLNFYCDFQNISVHMWECIQNYDFFKSNFYEKEELEKIVVEYSQPNTHKAMHVGHLRCLVLGDAVSNLLEFVGHKIVRATYPGDVGAHVAKLIWYITHPTPKKLPSENFVPWLGEMYAKSDEEIKKIKGSESEIEMKKEFSEILKQISAQRGSYYELWKLTREWSLNYLKDIYTWLHSHFDVWYFESECDEPSKKLVQKKLEEGFFIQDHGAIGLDLTEYKLGFAMFLKSDGHGLYLTKDLELLDLKFQDKEVTKSIYVVDSRQKFHFEQLFKTAELLGYKQAKKSHHLAYETVNTEDGVPFSSRALNGLGLFELKNKMEKKVMDDYLLRYRGQWSEREMELTAKNVSMSALKYGMLKVDNNTSITFSLSEWLRLDGETGPYLLYVHARCCSILEKQKEFLKEVVSFDYLELIEKELVFALWQFHQNVFASAQNYRPSILCSYLFDLCKKFNRFYENCPIKNAADHEKFARLAIVAMTQKVLEKGLQLLGIPAVEKM